MTFRIAAMFSCLIFGLGCGEGPPGPVGQVGEDGPPGTDATADDGNSVETCIQCHGPDGAVPVADITNAGNGVPADAHHVDTDIRGPKSDAGYRQLKITITEVDVRGTNVIMRFTVLDEDDNPVSNIFAADGRFTIATLQPGVNLGDATFYQSLINRIENPGSVGDGPGTPALQANSERFSTSGFDATNAASGSYVYTSVYNPSSPSGPNDLPVVDGQTYRLAIQLSAGDLPAGNGWCDFDADTTTNPNDCVSAVSITRDIVHTDTCNGCHGATNEVELTLHGGRTEVEYCQTCHNPGSTDANSGNTVDLKVMIHKIHAGAALDEGYKIWGFNNSLHDYSTVNWTASLDDCTFCHTGGGAQESNWRTAPTMEACGSCHDDVDFVSGVNHAAVAKNADCSTCHPADPGPWVPGTAPAPIPTVHLGLARNAEAALYGGSDGFTIDQVTWDGDDLTIDYFVTRNNVMMDLENDPEWRDLRPLGGGGASRLQLSVGWSTDEYTNEGSGSTPALPFSSGLNAAPADPGSSAVRVGASNVFRLVAPLPSGAGGTVTVIMDGHPAADLVPDGVVDYSDPIPVKSAFVDFDIENRGTPTSRRQVVDVTKCNRCHDSGRQGISLHGNNRTGEPQVCVVCHTQDTTDIHQRVTPPFADGKAEETVDFKNMIHRIHAGSDGNGIVVYGFGGSKHDFRNVEFIGDLKNCETCHFPGTYGAEDAWENTLATTIDTGADVADPSDDLNISSVASVCSGCHDGAAAMQHMVERGASFMALDSNIH